MREEPSPDAASQRIKKWERRLACEHRISLEGQQELRHLLGLNSICEGELRDRLIRLLNPRNARVIRVSDDDFNKLCVPIREDNYAPAEPQNVLDRHADFDSVHGFYVALNITSFRDFESL